MLTGREVAAAGDRAAAAGRRRCSRRCSCTAASGTWPATCCYLWIFGNNVEDAMGHVRFFIFYVLCGVAAVFAQVLPNPGSDRSHGRRERRDFRRARRLHAAVSARARVVRAAARLPDRAARTIPGRVGAGGVVRACSSSWEPRRRSDSRRIPGRHCLRCAHRRIHRRTCCSSQFSNGATFRCGGATETLLHSAHVARP